jgi:hypothetical protein
VVQTHKFHLTSPLLQSTLSTFSISKTLTQNQPPMAATGSKALAILAMAAVAISFLSSVVVAQEAPASSPSPQNAAIAGAIASPVAAGVLTSAVVLLLGSLRQ